jgi:hypothetical protein
MGWCCGAEGVLPLDAPYPRAPADRARASRPDPARAGGIPGNSKADVSARVTVAETVELTVA